MGQEEQKEKLLEVEEVRQKIEALKQSVAEMADYIKIEDRRKTLAALEAQQADADDVTFVYLLTHGSYTDSAGYYLQFSNGANYYADQLIADVSRISGHVVLVLCTCHSGRVFGSAKLKAIVNAGGAYTGTNGEGHLSVLCSSTDTNSSYYRTLNALQSYDFYTRAFTQGLGWNMRSDGPAALAAYRGYFLSVLVLIAPCTALVWRVIPLPEERRRALRHHHAPH